MLTRRYLSSAKNLSAIMAKIVEGTAPNKFTSAHLKGIGFKSSNDQAVLALLKDLRFLADDGTPLQRYHDYRNSSRSGAVMAEAIRDAYGDLFHINEKPGPADRPAILGKIKSENNVSDRVAELSTATFYALLKLADLDAPKSPPARQEKGKQTGRKTDARTEIPESGASLGQHRRSIDLRYNVEIHLPASKDVEVYNAIFRSLKEHIFDD